MSGSAAATRIARAVELALLLLAAFVFVLFASTLRDARLYVPLVESPVAPRLPDDPSAKDRDAVLSVEIVGEDGGPVGDARVTVLGIRGENAYLVGAASSGKDGKASFTGLPRGETFVLAESNARQRASTKVVLLAEPKSVRLTLRKSRDLVVSAVDEAKTPVPNATVEVLGGDPLPYRARTDAAGIATVGRLGPPPWNVRVSAPGYEAVSRSAVSASEIAVVLKALGAVEVTVELPSKEPAKGATVMVVGPRIWPARKATTGDDGKVRIAGLPGGAYDFSAMLGDLVSDTAMAFPVVQRQTAELTLVLGEGRRITVSVVDASEGDPRGLAGARVVLAEDGIAAFPREGVTDGDGNVVLGPVTSRAASVLVRADGYVPRGMLVPAKLEGPLVVSVVKGGTIVGEVVDERDDPVPGASVEVVGVDFDGMPVDETPERMAWAESNFAWSLAGPRPLIPAGELGVMPGPVPHIPKDGDKTQLPTPKLPEGVEPWISDKNGRFRAGPVSPGRLRAIVRHPGYVEGTSEPVDVAPGKESKVKVVLHTGATLSGRVLDEGGRPVAGARVEVAALHGSLVRATMSAEDGTFAFASVPSEISLSVARPEAIEAPVVKKQLTLGENEKRSIDVTIPSPRDPVSVRILDDRRYPLANVQISVVSLSPDVPLRTTRFSGDDGTASIPDASGLALRLAVSLPGHAPHVETVEKARAEITIHLRRGVMVMGEVRTRGGREPVDGADVVVLGEAGEKRAKTDKDGRYAVRDLAPGKARVVVTKKGYAVFDKSVTVPDVDADRTVDLDRIVLDEAGSVEGEVVDARGDPVVGARVAVDTAPAYLPVGPLPRGVAVTNAKGRFKLDDVPEGEVSIEAYSADKGRGREKVRVSRGDLTRDVRIRLDEAAADKEGASAGGVAVTLTESGDAGARVVSIRHVSSGSEAERAGLRKHDVVETIDGESPRSLEDARRRLSGPLGDDVMIKVSRDGESRTFRVQRERVRR